MQHNNWCYYNGLFNTFYSMFPLSMFNFFIIFTLHRIRWDNLHCGATAPHLRAALAVPSESKQGKNGHFFWKDQLNMFRRVSSPKWDDIFTRLEICRDADAVNYGTRSVIWTPSLFIFGQYLIRPPHRSCGECPLRRLESLQFRPDSGLPVLLVLNPLDVPDKVQGVLLEAFLCEVADPSLWGIIQE